MASVLAGCSGSSVSMPDWLSSKPSPPKLQTLHFQSEPPGADVRTAKGQTCQTPCSFPVSSENQSVTFEKEGFVPQTVQVNVAERGELTPDPVDVVLQAEAKPTKKSADRKAGVHTNNRQTQNSPSR